MLPLVPKIRCSKTAQKSAVQVCHSYDVIDNENFDLSSTEVFVYISANKINMSVNK